ncbi:hypothetical protein D9M73_68920 [compost metagenome]
MNPGTCIHYMGMLPSLDGKPRLCAAGVDYEKEFDNSRPGIGCRAPCIEYMVVRPSGRGTRIHANEIGYRKEWPRRGETVIPCSRRIEPTDEQVAQDRAETDAYMNRVFLAIKVAGEWRVKPKPAATRREVVECPACKGKLNLVQFASNGHVHGSCETTGCLSWME